MKKLVAICIISTMLVMSGCGDQKMIESPKYNKAILFDGDNRIELNIQDCCHNSNGMISFTTTDGTIYFTHGSNLILINE